MTMPTKILSSAPAETAEPNQIAPATHDLAPPTAPIDTQSTLKADGALTPAAVASPAPVEPAPVEVVPVAPVFAAPDPASLVDIKRNAPSEVTVVTQSTFDNRPSWTRIAGYAALSIAVVASATAYGVYASWLSGGRIAPGLIIQGEPVGGLTTAEAKSRLEKRFGRLFVTFETPNRPYKLALKQIGGQPQIGTVVQNAYWFGRNGNVFANVWNVYEAKREAKRLPLPIKWDKTQMRRTMWAVAKNYERAPRDATLRVSSSGVEVVSHQVGRSLNVGATLLNLQKKYFAGLPEVQAIAKRVMPRLTAADLAGRDVLLGKYTTFFDSGLWGRTRNIYVAAATIDGVVLMPGELFSFNGRTGERTWDKGYRMAHIFERKPGKSEAEVVDGLAGGVCQVSSTLYNAVRKSNKQIDYKLRIVERNYHSLPVTYVPSGLDATVAWPHKDFRFRNTLEHPVYLRAIVNGSRLTTSVWGRVPENPRQLAGITVPATSTESAPISAVEPPTDESSRDDSKRQARL